MLHVEFPEFGWHAVWTWFWETFKPAKHWDRSVNCCFFEFSSAEDSFARISDLVPARWLEIRRKSCDSAVAGKEKWERNKKNCTSRQGSGRKKSSNPASEEQFQNPSAWMGTYWFCLLNLCYTVRSLQLEREKGQCDFSGINGNSIEPHRRDGGCKPNFNQLPWINYESPWDRPAGRCAVEAGNSRDSRDLSFSLFLFLTFACTKILRTRQM